MHNSQPEWVSGDPATVERLRRRYNLLRELLVELRGKWAETNPELDRTAPPAEVYLEALEKETAIKDLQGMTSFVDKELKKALLDLQPDHPVKLALKQQYRDAVATLMPVVADRIAKGESLIPHMAFLAVERRRIAEEVCDLPSKYFGEPRENLRSRLERTVFTVKGRFRAYLDRVVPLVPVGSKEFILPNTFDRFVGWSLAPKIDGITLWANMKGHRIPLSTYLVLREAPDDVGLEWLFWDEDNDWPAADIIHTDEKLIHFVRDFCSDLFNNIQEKKLQGDDLIDAAAELQWYLAHGMFYKRGSAAIAEWVITGLFLSKGIRIVWSKQPDLEALMCMNPELFISRYREFTQWR